MQLTSELCYLQNRPAGDSCGPWGRSGTKPVTPDLQWLRQGLQGRWEEERSARAYSVNYSMDLFQKLGVITEKMNQKSSDEVYIIRVEVRVEK